MSKIRILAWTCCFVAVGTQLRADSFPEIYNTGPVDAQPMSPKESLASFRFPEGFHATVFASEPDVLNPIGLSWDGRGRLWVAENFAYAERPLQFDRRLRDRILIFTDEDGDGHADSRKVFSEQVQMLSSIAVGHKGVWALCLPQLIFIPDQNGDDIPDGTPQVVLDGFDPSMALNHTFANGLKWGPDGWLYGRCGASSPADVGPPGTPPEKRIPMRGGIWRYHPERKVFESFASGTTNPWGHDWDAEGELFFINTVNGHLWHALAGGQFDRPHTLAPHPHAYEFIDLHADHYHFDMKTGDGRSAKDLAEHDYGGGHVHMGTVIYQGGQWPEKYNGHLFTLNFHGHRINDERLERSGSGYIARHDPDFCHFPDPWFRGTDLATGPDGSVFILDWSDTGECHERDGVHRTSGRIYKLSYGDAAPQAASNLDQLSNLELSKLQLHQNDWYARESRRLLRNRFQDGVNLDDAKQELGSLLRNNPSQVVRLRALWTKWQINALSEAQLRGILTDSNEHVRVWAIRLLTDHWLIDNCEGRRVTEGQERTPPADLMNSFIRMAREDSSAMVRVTLASVLQRIPEDLRPALAAPLICPPGRCCRPRHSIDGLVRPDTGRRPTSRETGAARQSM